MASVLTKAQLDELRRKLEAERTRILGVLAAPAAEAPSSRAGDGARGSGAARDRADAGRESRRASARSSPRSSARSRSSSEGTYGVSEETGDPIPYERLAVVPWARGGVDE